LYFIYISARNFGDIKIWLINTYGVYYHYPNRQ